MTAIFLAPVYILVNVYIFWRVTGWLKVGFPALRTRGGVLASAAVYSFFALSFLIAFLMPPQAAACRVMKQIGNYWLGVLLYMILIIVVADVTRLVLLHILHIDRKKLCTPRIRRIVGRACMVLILAVSVLGVVNAGIVRTTPYEITVNKQAGKMDSLKVVLAADLHLGYNIGVRQMQKMVEKINEQDADLVVFAGDIFDNEWDAVEKPDEIAEILRGIRSKYGVYACYGNHDVEEPILAGFTFGGSESKQSSTEMDAFLEQANIRLLQDEGVLIDGSFYLYGRPDAQRPGAAAASAGAAEAIAPAAVAAATAGTAENEGTTQEVSAQRQQNQTAGAAGAAGHARLTPDEITQGMDKSKPILVIDHQPRELAELAAAGVDVDLCGHTHDGQIFPANIIVNLTWENAYGYLKEGKMHNIVTSGVGLFGPNMRVGTKAEICPITIRFEG